MRNAWRWAVLVAALMIIGMFGLSVLAVPAPATSMAVDVSAPEARPINIRLIPHDMQIPKSGPVRPQSVIVTWDGSRWRAFSNRTGPFGCEVEVRPGDKSWQVWPGVVLAQILVEVCHGAIYDLTGLQISGPRRTLYEYPVQEVRVETLEIDLGHPAPAAGQP